MKTMNIYLYGPPGSGKSTLGSSLAASLDMPFVDLDEVIAREAGVSIPDIFAGEAEVGFRQREMAALKTVSSGGSKVVALGGGALLDQRARNVAEESGQILCLRAELESLLTRLGPSSAGRPLLTGDSREKLAKLLFKRSEHYRSFPLHLGVDGVEPDELTRQAQIRLGAFRVRGMGQPYDVRIARDGLTRLGDHLEARGLKGPVAVVSDRNVAVHHLGPVLKSLQRSGYRTFSFEFEAGEARKTIQTVLDVWDFFIQTGIERGSTVVALGGGVVGDLTGFAAATYLRGVAWVNLPTSLLAMVDSSLGGKTGVDLPQAKNLVGSFFPPRLVLVDPDVLKTLPECELRSGLAEAIKHGVISDPDLFDMCAAGWQEVTDRIEQVVQQGMAVKLHVINVDPYEQGLRQALNLGHTIGHGIELASDFCLSHGEAVAIGMVAETRLAEALGLAEDGLADKIVRALSSLGLPTAVPAGLDLCRVVEAMQFDKKRASGKIRFALPTRIGEVRTGVVVENWQQMTNRILQGGAQ